MKRILFITNDVIGDSAAGPGIRYRELGAALARKGHTVTVMGRSPSFQAPQPFVPAKLSAGNIIRHVSRNDCVVFRGGGPLTTLLLMLFARSKVLIADLYAFTQFEVPHMVARNIRERLTTEVRKRFHLFKFRLYGGFCSRFWVANDHQMHFLHGLVYGAGRAPESKSIAVVPFGFSSVPPVKRKEVLRGVVRGIDHGDYLLIWGGGVWDWLDPLTLVHAMRMVRDSDPRIKLYFLGTRSPSGYLPAQAERLTDAARRFGLLDATVFINASWVPYEDRIDYLLEADAGISLHHDSLETRYAFRTRNLDYLYCGLPMIHSDGDAWADIIRNNRIGLVVPPGDAQAVADAIIRMHRDRPMYDSMKRALGERGGQFTWDAIAERAIRSIEQRPSERAPSAFRAAAAVAYHYGMFCFSVVVVFGKALLRPRQG